MRKIKRTYVQGRPIKGWSYGRRVTSVEQIKPGDILIGDSHQFKATNLYRVVPLPALIAKLRRHDGQPGTPMFYIEFITPNRRHSDGQEMCVHFWEVEQSGRLHTAYYIAHRVKKPALMS
jgi:hypothetical protein